MKKDGASRATRPSARALRQQLTIHIAGKQLGGLRIATPIAVPRRPPAGIEIH